MASQLAVRRARQRLVLLSRREHLWQIDRRTLGRFSPRGDRNKWGAGIIMGLDSLIESRKWWLQEECSPCLIEVYLRALDVNHIVFGHDPTAFSRPGEIGQEEDGRIFLIDVGMTPVKDFSPGALLIIETRGSEAVASSFGADDSR